MHNHTVFFAAKTGAEQFGRGPAVVEQYGGGRVEIAQISDQVYDALPVFMDGQAKMLRIMAVTYSEFPKDIAPHRRGKLHLVIRIRQHASAKVSVRHQVPTGAHRRLSTRLNVSPWTDVC
jgi:hypothetical protein